VAGLLLAALDGFQVRVPDTPANREYFGSSGTADNSSPFPQVRAVILTAARTKGTLGLEFGPSCDGEQTLTRRLVRSRPGIFGEGRLILMDRNFPGFALIKEIREQGAHLLMRIKSGIVLPLVKALPDGSYASFLSDGACCIPVRVVEYDVTVPGRDGAGMSCTRWPSR
jgi:Transposase DDE domain